MIAIFKRYARGRCQNASDRALRVTACVDACAFIVACVS